MFILLSIILFILLIFVVATYYLQPFGHFALSSKPRTFYLLVIILVILFGLSLTVGIKNLSEPYQTQIQVKSGKGIHIVEGIKGEAMYLHEDRFRVNKKYNMPLFTWDNIPNGNIKVNYIRDGKVVKSENVIAQINPFYKGVQSKLDAKFCYYFPVTFPKTGDWELEFVTVNDKLGPIKVYVLDKRF